MAERKIQGITPEGRLNDLRDMAASFSKHLKTSPGTILAPNFRLGVAKYAREVYLDENCSASARVASCSRPGTGFYAHCASLEHRPAFPVTGAGAVSAEVQACLANIVYAIIFHQSKLDRDWYKDAIEALASCGIVEDYANMIDGEVFRELDIKLGSHAAFCEVLVLAAVSHGIHVTFLSLEEEVPPLPSWEEMEGSPGPSNLRFSSLLKNARSDGPGVGWAPYFNRGDLNTGSLEYAKIRKEMWNKIRKSLSPAMCTRFAPSDNVILSTLIEGTLYLAPNEQVWEWNVLNPLTRCSGVNRRDIETVAAAIAEKHGSQMCKMTHCMMRESAFRWFGLRDKALIELGNAIAAIPRDVTWVRAGFKGVKRQGGMELAIEAAATAGALEMMTRVADATGLRMPPEQLKKLGRRMALAHFVKGNGIYLVVAIGMASVAYAARYFLH